MPNLTTLQPTISVIIPLYNAAPFIAAALESVLGQTRPPNQVIVVDDGATDGSADVVRRYGQQITLIQQPNAGGASARNRGVALATGDLLAFLDHDDYWVPEKLAWQLDAFQQAPHLEAVFGQLQQTQPLNTADQATALFGLNAQDGCHLDTLLIRRAAFQRIGPFDPTWTIDTVEWLWRARRLDLCTQILPQVLAWRRIHGDNLSIRARPQLQAEYLRLIRQQLGHQRGVFAQER